MNNAPINNHPFQNFMEPAGKKINNPTRNNKKRYTNNALKINKLLFSDLINSLSLIYPKLFDDLFIKITKKKSKVNFILAGRLINLQGY